MIKLGKGNDSLKYWEEKGGEYSANLVNGYHQHRLKVIDALIPKQLYGEGKNIFDFGCGDAIHFRKFIESGAIINGIDISNEMISLGKKRLSEAGFSPNLIKKADVNFLKEIKSESLDAVLSFNVLAYLTDNEEEIFYTEVGITPV